MVNGFHDGFKRRFVLPFAAGLRHRFGDAADDGQGIADLMRDAEHQISEHGRVRSGR